MGADARIALYHRNRAQAEAAIGAAIAEVSSGAFDITVQPLWRLYVDHFARFPNYERGPPDEAIARACASVDYRKLRISPDGIRLDPGMAVTLNGIAQGYVTDRVADVLRAHGFADVLIDLGEFRALGRHPDGRSWTIGLSAPGRPQRLFATVPLASRAAATSAGSGTIFDRAGRHHHLLQPRTGRSVSEYASVTVFAERATTADALATALYVTPRAETSHVLRRFPSVEAWLIGKGGMVERLSYGIHVISSLRLCWATSGSVCWP